MTHASLFLLWPSENPPSVDNEGRTSRTLDHVYLLCLDNDAVHPISQAFRYISGSQKIGASLFQLPRSSYTYTHDTDIHLVCLRIGALLAGVRATIHSLPRHKWPIAGPLHLSAYASAGLPVGVLTAEAVRVWAGMCVKKATRRAPATAMTCTAWRVRM